MKRKPRKKFSQDQSIDMMKPLPLEKVGTPDDPCFGKFHDPSAEECQRCGDSEICSIVCGQNLHHKRKLIEEKQKFKDLQKIDLDWKYLLKTIKGRLNKYPEGLTLPQLKDKVVKRLHISEATFDKHYAILRKKMVFAKRVSIKNNLYTIK